MMKKLLGFVFSSALLFALFSINAQAGDKPCPRIISQSPYLTKSLQWLGLQSCIVGVSRYDQLELPHTGGIFDPDAEAIAALSPDLIFTSDWTDPEILNAATPKGVRSSRLGGFDSMQQIEDNLRLIGRETGIGTINTQVNRFHQQWISAATEINGRGKKVLLLSACSGSPYSFGKKRWLSELFTHAGFSVVETAETIRHIKPGEEIVTINALINELEPELLFIFERKQHRQCAFIKPKTTLTIINLDGEKFLHPAPVLLDGLKELALHSDKWSH